LEPVLQNALAINESGISDLKNRLLKNGFYNTIAGAVRVGLALLTIPLLIRLMGVDEYGLWALASAIVGLVALAEAGLSTATTVFVSQDLAKQDTEGLSQTLTITFGAMLILATSGVVALWCNAEAIVILFPKLEPVKQVTVTHALQLGGVVVWARLLQQILVGVEQAYQQYGLLSLLNTLQWVLMSLGFFAVAWVGGRTVDLMQWQVVATSAGLASHAWVVWTLLRHSNIHLAWTREKGMAVLKYSLLTWLTSLGGAFFLKGDRVIVGALLGSTALGVYAAITDVTGAINLFSALPVQPLLPTLSNFIANSERNCEELQQQIKQAIEVSALVALLMGTSLFTFASLIMHTMISAPIGNEEILAFRIATTIYALYSINAVGYYVLFGVNQVKRSMAIHLFSGTFSLLLIIFGASHFSLMGAVSGNTGYLCVWLLTIFGMKSLSIRGSTWFKWLSFPLGCFLGFALIGFAIGERFGLVLCLGILQVALLIKWFTDAQPEGINIFTQRLKTRRN
jgi:O-antigen/teichoic acid export membrane protein